MVCMARRARLMVADVCTQDLFVCGGVQNFVEGDAHSIQFAERALWVVTVILLQHHKLRSVFCGLRVVRVVQCKQVQHCSLLNHQMNKMGHLKIFSDQ